MKPLSYLCWLFTIIVPHLPITLPMLISTVKYQCGSCHILYMFMSVAALVVVYRSNRSHVSSNVVPFDIVRCPSVSLLIIDVVYHPWLHLILLSLIIRLII